MFHPSIPLYGVSEPEPSLVWSPLTLGWGGYYGLVHLEGSRMSLHARE